MLPSASKSVVIGSSDYISLLDGLKIINLNSPKKEENNIKSKNSETSKHNVSYMHCITCQIAFEVDEEHKAHYKSEWHRFNLKQKIRNKNILNESEFLSLEKNNVDCSSSDESDNEILEYNSYFSIESKLFFENKLGSAISLYKCLVTSSKDISNEKELIKSVKLLCSEPKWLIVMLGGGRFSAAIFKGEESIVHKTFHSYTVRAKQGGSQSTQDRSKGGSKSAGASLRRYNESSQLKHVQDILSSWTTLIKECDRLFYRAIGPFNRNILFGGTNPLLNKKDPRLCQIPFGTRRAIYNEVLRVREQLSTVLVYDNKEILYSSIKNYLNNLLIKKKIKEAKQHKCDEDNSKSILKNENDMKSLVIDSDKSDEHNNSLVPSLSEEDNQLPNYNHFNRFKDLKKRRKRKKKPKQQISNENHEIEELRIKLLSWIEEKVNVAVENLPLVLGTKSEEEIENYLNTPLDDLNNTILHLASLNSLHNHIYLLLKNGSNPALKNKNLKTPYDVAIDKSTRKVFRKFMADYPEKYDYEKAHLPGALTLELQEELKERKKAKQKRAKERKLIEELKKEEEKEKEKFLNLSDREKCAIAAEKRLIALQGKVFVSRCFYCGSNIEEKVSFGYMDYKFCSTLCVRNHRQQNIAK
ncbi:ankyrin repeat and zinc finger domain-containing protein 1-like isoform X1 [Daktulosphaira vitifoliae]|uniref:ankyrin repeat and zinc finger domain-containing protein 1-like isoform X1 n=1 Tax=Daktulosphaira vitifoliae TaxID=58002 RepID=UPI0021AB0729|nr:ankyrin repeat and zinc finger domain-containing protein 1-like isoform X1 [Daktulosphaira vitifoliae]